MTHENCLALEALKKLDALYSGFAQTVEHEDWGEGWFEESLPEVREAFTLAAQALEGHADHRTQETGLTARALLREWVDAEWMITPAWTGFQEREEFVDKTRAYLADPTTADAQAAETIRRAITTLETSLRFTPDDIYNPGRVVLADLRALHSTLTGGQG